MIIQGSQKYFGHTRWVANKCNSIILPIYTVTETHKLDCQFGKHYFKERVRKNTKRTILQGTHKVGCLAKVIVKQLTLFPEYSISANLLNQKQLRNEREKQLLQLKEDLANCKVTVHRINKYFISLPTKEAHNHPVGPGVAGFAQKIHPKLRYCCGRRCSDCTRC